MGILDRLMRLFGQPAPVAGEEVLVEPPFAEGMERRMKERKPVAQGIKVLIIDDSTTIVALLRRMIADTRKLYRQAVPDPRLLSGGVQP